MILTDFIIALKIEIINRILNLIYCVSSHKLQPDLADVMVLQLDFLLQQLSKYSIGCS